MTDVPPTATVRPTCPQCGAPVALPEYADAAVCEYCGSALKRDQAWVLDKEQGREADRYTLRSIRCSQCAGPLSAHEGKRVLRCDHCGVRVALLEHGGVTRWYFPCRIERARAVSLAREWLEEHPGIAPAVREAEPVEAKLAYAPIWEHKVLAAGWEFGIKHRTRLVLQRAPVSAEGEESLEVDLRREGVQESRLDERRFYMPAVDFEAIDACRPRINGRELLVPLVAGELDPSALVLEAKGEPSEVVERGRSAARAPLTGALEPDLHLFLFREAAALLYYPLWLLRFRKGDSYCRVVVDGRDGSINSGSAPADQRTPLVAHIAKIAALVVTAAILVYLAVRFEPARTPLLVGAVVLSVAAGVLGFRFKPERGVEYHDSFSS